MPFSLFAHLIFFYITYILDVLHFLGGKLLVVLDSAKAVSSDARVLLLSSR